MSTYGFLPIAGATLLVYFVSYFLTKTNTLKFITHRRVWNILLMLSFFIAGTLGFLMALIYSFEINLDIPYAILQIHVGFGITWFIIATFHFLWHLSYFRKAIKVLFTKNKS